MNRFLDGFCGRVMPQSLPHAVSATLRIVTGTLLLLIIGLQAAQAEDFVATGPLKVARVYHTATLLKDGRVLFAGGGVSPSVLASAEIYDPATDQSTLLASSMNAARAFHTATLLNDGRVLIAGGLGNGGALTSAEIFNPATGQFTPVANQMQSSRLNHTATLLPDGRVLIVGGGAGSASALTTADIFNPTSGSFSSTGSLNVARFGHTATLYTDGTGKKWVLIAGGGVSPSNSAEKYDIGTGGFSLTPAMTAARRYHTATLLSDNRVVIAGGNTTGVTGTAEMYTPATGTFASSGTMLVLRKRHGGNLLPNGDVFLSGGSDLFNFVTDTTETFITPIDPANGQFTNSSPMSSPRYGHTATTLGDGVSVLVAGGLNDLSIPTLLTSMQVYNPGLMNLRPLAHAFPTTLLGTTTPPFAFTVKNNFPLSLNIISVGITGVDSSQFHLAGGTCVIPGAVPGNGGSCTILVNFAPTAGGAKSAMLEVITDDFAVQNLSAALTGTGWIHTVNVTRVGDGSATVSSNPAGFSNCVLDSGHPVCSASFTAPATLTLTVNPASYLSGWVPASCSGLSCLVPMTVDDVSVALYLYPVKIVNGGYFLNLDDAYASPIANGTVIQAISGRSFPGGMHLNKNVGVTLQGGCSSTFVPSTGSTYSSITGGALFVESGSVIIDRIAVQ